MRFRNIEERYWHHVRNERNILAEYTKREQEDAESLLLFYKIQKRDIPDDIYRAVCFFSNSEFKKKTTALVMLYEIKQKVDKDLPLPTKETMLDQLCYRFQVYGTALLKENI